MEENNFSEKESLQLINEMIGKAKKSHIEKGIASILWGTLITFCSLVSLIEAHFKINVGDVWFLTVIAVVVQVYFSIKESKNRNYKSYEGETLSFVWTAFGISVFLTSFIVANLLPNKDTTGLFMMLYAIPTFITGGVTKFKPMIYGGCFCWVASIISIYTPVEIDLILMACCGLFAWFIPGIILWKRYKKNLATNV
jgi:hypothetical protein